MLETLCKAYVWDSPFQKMLILFSEVRKYVVGILVMHKTCITDPENSSLRLNLHPGCLHGIDVVISFWGQKKGNNSLNW